MRKSELSRPYPPEFVSAETLAYRLDCSVSAIHDYTKAGLIPKPLTIGNLVRWRWSDIVEVIEQRNSLSGVSSSDSDEYTTDLAKIGKKTNGCVA